MESSSETRGQPEAASRTEEDGTVGIGRNEIDIGSTTVGCSIDGEWPRVYSSRGSNGLIQSGPNHRDMI